MQAAYGRRSISRNNSQFREAVLRELPAVRGVVQRIRAIDPCAWDGLVAAVPDNYASSDLRERNPALLALAAT